MQMTLRPLFPVALLITALALSLGSAQAYAQDDDGNRIFEGVTIESEAERLHRSGHQRAAAAAERHVFARNAGLDRRQQNC